MKFEDIKGVFKKHELSIESIDNPYGDYYTVRIKNDTDVNWAPGDHAMITLPGKKIQGQKYRMFSVASVPNEGVLLLGTRTGKEKSSFKKALLEMEAGEKISIRGPFGWFKLQDETSPIVLFASGVGVTPIRSLLKQLEFNTNRPVEVVYSSSQYYLFGNEIEEIAVNNPKINLYKLSSKEETTAQLEKLAQHYGNSAYYYNSGAPAVLKSVKEQYIKNGIHKKRIIADAFMGVK